MNNKKFSLVFLIIILFVSGIAYAADVQLTNDGKVPGKPFEELQQQIDVLKQQITDLQQVGLIGHNTKFEYQAVSIASGDSAYICAYAPYGKHIVGGGGLAENPSSPFALSMIDSYPLDGNCTTADYSFSMDSWCAYWRNDSDQTWNGTIYAFIISVGEEYTGPFYGCN